MTKKTLKIEGMTCASCSAAVERVTKKLDGVVESNVNLATEKLNIDYDENKVSEEDIRAAVEKAGYKAFTDTVNRTLIIEGMTCASCSAAVERVTRKLDGVSESSVNLATEKLNIRFDSSKVRISDIKRAVEKAGYKAKEEEITIDLDKEKKEIEIKALWKRFFISAVFTIPLLYIAMGHMVGLPLPELINPEINPEYFAIAQL